MPSIQKLHEILWDLSEVIWKNIEDYGLNKVKENTSTLRIRNYWRIGSHLADSKTEVAEVKIKIQENTLYDQALKIFVEKYNLSHEDARSKLDAFVHGMIIRLVADNESKFISQQLVIFMDELEENPIKYSLSLTLDRFYSKSEELAIELIDNIKIVSHKDKHFNWIEFGIEGTIHGVTIDYGKITTENIVYTLRLYGLAGLEITDGFINPDCFLQKQLGMNTLPSDSPYILEIDKKDINILQKFFRKFFPQIVKARSDSKLSYIDISLQRFADALLRRGSDEQRITYAITSLEALLLGPKEREGLSRRLGQRIAGLLGLLGKNPVEVYTTVLQAYDVRSTFIHGGKVEDNISVEVICDEILGITRDCLISFLQLLDHNKEKIINFLDQAILDEKVKEKLSEVLTNIEIIPFPS